MFKGIAVILAIAYVYMLIGLPDVAKPFVDFVMYGLGGWTMGNVLVWVWKRDVE